MRHHRWEILTNTGATMRGTDSMPKPGVKDNARGMKIEVAGHPATFTVIVPYGAELILCRNVEKRFTIAGKEPNPPWWRKARMIPSGVAEVVDYEFGWQLGETISVVQVGWTQHRVGLLRRRVITEAYAILKDFLGEEPGDG